MGEGGVWEGGTASGQGGWIAWGGDSAGGEESAMTFHRGPAWDLPVSSSPGLSKPGC